MEALAVEATTAARLIGVDVRTLKRKSFDDLPFYREGTKRMYTLDTLKAYVAARQDDAMQQGPQLLQHQPEVLRAQLRAKMLQRAMHA